MHESLSLNGQIGFGWSEQEEKALAQPVQFDFPFGHFTAKPTRPVCAFDTTALGINADYNSLRFTEDGRVAQVITSGDILVRHRKTGAPVMFSSRVRPGLTDDATIKEPIRISFSEDATSINSGDKSGEYALTEYDFLVMPDTGSMREDCAGSCGGCSGCD